MKESIKDLAGLSSSETTDKLRAEFLEKYPDPPTELPEADVDRLSQKHLYAADKWYRMCSGSSSELLSYKDQVIELEISTTRQTFEAEGKPKYTLRNQIKSWLNEYLLQKAEHMIVHVMERGTPAGLIIDAKDRTPKSIVKRLKQMAEPSADIKLCEWKLSASDLRKDPPEPGTWPPKP